jgi:hypothetical protein
MFFDGDVFIVDLFQNLQALRRVKLVVAAAVVNGLVL